MKIHNTYNSVHPILTVPFNTQEQINERINLIRKYSAFGYDPKQIREMLAKNFQIKVTLQQIYHDLQQIREGKYDNSFLDLLLDVNYPAIYEQVLQGLDKDLKWFDDFSKRDDVDESLKLKAKRYHSQVEVEMLSALHRGAIVRMMKQLSSKTKILARETLRQESILRQSNYSQKPESSLYTTIVKFDENLQKVGEELVLTEELEKQKTGYV